VHILLHGLVPPSSRSGPGLRSATAKVTAGASKQAQLLLHKKVAASCKPQHKPALSRLNNTCTLRA
jgi:hypothetical protein